MIDIYDWEKDRGRREKVIECINNYYNDNKYTTEDFINIILDNKKEWKLNEVVLSVNVILKKDLIDLDEDNIIDTIINNKLEGYNKLGLLGLIYPTVVANNKYWKFVSYMNRIVKHIIDTLKNNTIEYTVNELNSLIELKPDIYFKNGFEYSEELSERLVKGVKDILKVLDPKYNYKLDESILEMYYEIDDELTDVINDSHTFQC